MRKTRCNLQLYYKGRLRKSRLQNNSQFHTIQGLYSQFVVEQQTVLHNLQLRSAVLSLENSD